MQKAKEAAAEAKAQSGGGFRLVGEGGVIELELFQRFPQVGVLGTIRRINAAEHHGIDAAVAGQRLGAGFSAPVTVSPTRVSATVLMLAVK